MTYLHRNKRPKNPLKHRHRPEPSLHLFLPRLAVKLMRTGSQNAPRCAENTARSVSKILQGIGYRSLLHILFAPMDGTRLPATKCHILLHATYCHPLPCRTTAAHRAQAITPYFLARASQSCWRIAWLITSRGKFIFAASVNFPVALSSFSAIYIAPTPIESMW